MREPTPRQFQVIAIIDRHIWEHGWPPTIREIAHDLGVNSTNAVTDNLDALEAKGLIVRGENRESRAIRITFIGAQALKRYRREQWT